MNCLLFVFVVVLDVWFVVVLLVVWCCWLYLLVVMWFVIGVFVLWVVVMLLFVVVYFVLGDIVGILIGEQLSMLEIEVVICQEWGFDELFVL